MEEIKIGERIEKDLAQERHEDVKASHKDGYGEGSDNLKILLVIAFVVGLFVLSIGGFKVYNQLTAASVVNVDDLHDENLVGSLNEEEGYVYNGFSFVKVDGLWWTELTRFNTLLKIPLHFGPRDVEEISFSGQLTPEFNVGEWVHVAIDPNVQDKHYTLALSELSFNMAKGINRGPIGSCTEENWACENRTIVSCENNPENKPVIELALAEETGVELQGPCIKISGSGYDLVKAVDRVLYHWYGVI